MIRIVSSILALAIICTAFPPSAEAYTRSCQGFYKAVETLRNGVPPGSSADWKFGRFNMSVGGCKHPNDCRRAARGRIFECYRAHWKSRWDFKKPASCHAIERYGISNIKLALEKTVCCGAHGKRYSNLVVDLYGISHGDKRCPRTERLQVGYKLNCAALRPKIC